LYGAFFARFARLALAEIRQNLLQAEGDSRTSNQPIADPGWIALAGVEMQIQVSRHSE
jgi:hypothetical protein